ncbi:MAG: AI-2E family transporter [Oscillospiraceae bacterium]|nr:AI-2E family transporter [Oscillospiraceae bacterium]
MKDPNKRQYLYLMLSFFGAISLSILVFFLVYRFQGVGDIFHQLSDILAPFIYGSVVAYLLRPACNWYEGILVQYLPRKGKKLASGLAVTLSLITGIFVVYVLIIMIVPQLYSSVLSLWTTLPQKVSQFIAWARDTFGEEENIAQLLHLFDTSTTALYQDLEAWVTTTVGPYISNIVSGVGSSVYKVFMFVYDMLIGLIVACYVLASRKKFARQSVLVVRSLLKPKWADLFLNEVAFVDRMFGGFIDGKILDSAIIGVLCYIGCMIFKFPNALLVSAIVGITNVIPFFGPFIGAVPSTLLIMIEDPIKGLWFILFVLALQQLDGNVIGPAILGDRTGLSSFWVLFAIILCGGLWGIVGMVVCVPMFAVIYDTVKKLVRRGLSKKGQSQLWDEYKTEYPDEEPKKK